MSPLLAASALDKAQNVSPQFWLKVILVIVAIIAAAFLIRWIMQLNKLFLGLVIFVIVGIIGFNWIYERNEPKFLTPFISVVAQWFPSKGAYEAKQQQDPGKPGVTKTAPKPAQPTTK